MFIAITLVPLNKLSLMGLHIFMITDIANISDIICSILFVDDTNIFISDEHLDEIMDNINTQLKKSGVWLNASNLSLNIDETHGNIFNISNRKYIKPSKRDINDTTTT